jgi:hypothetical protein
MIDKSDKSVQRNERQHSADKERFISRFSIRAVTAPAINNSARRAMFDLLARYYDDVNYDQFQDDFNEKQYVIQLFDTEDRLLGFSTIQLIESVHHGRPIITLFSGDTVVDKACWGQKVLQRAFVSFIIQLKLKKPWRRVYWFLITKGYKTYLLIRKNFHCYPNHEHLTPKSSQDLLDSIARIKYPNHYQADEGLIHFTQGQGKVKESFEDISQDEKTNPDIAFFLRVNPNYKSGAELCCLAEVRLRDLIYVGLKYFCWKPLQRFFLKDRVKNP